MFNNELLQRVTKLEESVQNIEKRLSSSYDTLWENKSELLRYISGLASYLDVEIDGGSSYTKKKK